MSASKPKLKALGESAKKNRRHYEFEGPHPQKLEAFNNPLKDSVLNSNLHQRPMLIDIDIPEFTSLCPITGQPDTASLHIQYSPRKKCVESKSLKLYLMSYRQAGAFHEECCQRIANDLIKLMDPQELVITGTFAARGGISFNPKVSYVRKEAAQVAKKHR